MLCGMGVPRMDHLPGAAARVQMRAVLERIRELTLQFRLDSVWDETSTVLKIVQTAAVMEIVHAATHLVPSSVNSVFMQGAFVSICG